MCACGRVFVVLQRPNLCSILEVPHSAFLTRFLLYLLAWPDVIVQDLTSEHEFIVLACDGKIKIGYELNCIKVQYIINVRVNDLKTKINVQHG